jgi:hypothetical protein
MRPHPLARPLFLASGLALPITGWTDTRAGIILNARPADGFAVGPDAALRVGVPGVDVHLDLAGLYARGPDDDLVGVIEMAAGEDSNCATELPNFWNGQTSLDARAALGIGPIHLRGGLSSQLQTGLPGDFSEHLADECQIAVEGPSHSLNLGPTAGVFFHLGPVEATVDLVYRQGALGTDPYKWLDEPDGGPLKARDFVNPTLELPMRVVAGVGPLYVRSGVTLSLDLPTKNSKLLHEDSPDVYDEPEAETHLQLNIGLGVRL